MFGDPHVVTFDNMQYTFNGKGEFVLVHVDTQKQKLDVQARFEQMPPNIYGPVMATQLTSVAGSKRPPSNSKRLEYPFNKVFELLKNISEQIFS